MRFKVPTWFFCDKQLPRQPLLKRWKKVATTGRTERGNGHRVGETHHRAKLSDHEVELIRCLSEGGMRVVEIARKFECSPDNIRKIVYYRSRIGIGMAVNKVFE
mgnify:CR=1 FL=1